MNTAMIDKVNRSEFRERPFTKKKRFQRNKQNDSNNSILSDCIFGLEAQQSSTEQVGVNSSLEQVIAHCLEYG